MIWPLLSNIWHVLYMMKVRTRIQRIVSLRSPECLEDSPGRLASQGHASIAKSSVVSIKTALPSRRLTSVVNKVLYCFRLKKSQIEPLQTSSHPQRPLSSSCKMSCWLLFLTHMRIIVDQASYCKFGPSQINRP